MATAEIDARLVPQLKEPRLPTIRGCYEEESEMARRESLSDARYLLELIEHEQQVAVRTASSGSCASRTYA